MMPEPTTVATRSKVPRNSAVKRLRRSGFTGLADPINFFPVHTYLLAEAGVPIIEIMQLDELAADKVWEFAFFGACIKLRGATGAPMRPVAMPLVDSPII